MCDYGFEVRHVYETLEKQNIKCLMCSSSAWNILVNNEMYNVLKKDFAWDTVWKVVNTIKLECQECGFVMEYNPYILMRDLFPWRYNQPIDVEKDLSGWPIGLQGNENDSLDERQKKFVKEFAMCRDAGLAAYRSGYNPRTAFANGVMLLSLRKIIKAIKQELNIE